MLLLALFGVFLTAHQAEALVTINLTRGQQIPEKVLKNCRHDSDPTYTDQTTHVYVRLVVLDIDEIKEDTMEFRIHAYVILVWMNPSLKLYYANQSDPVILPTELSSCMWHPDVIFPNSKEVIFFKELVPNLTHKLLTDGFIYMCGRYLIRISCPMNFKRYPMDNQNCFFKIALVANPDHHVTLHWCQEPSAPELFRDCYGAEYAYKQEPLEFKAETPVVDKQVLSWPTGNYTELLVQFTFQRRLTGSLVNVFIPSLLVVILSWLSFWIDIQAAPARVTLGVTTLLTVFTQVVNSRVSLPPVQYITGLDVWLFFCLALVFASLLEYSMAYNIETKRKLNNVTSISRNAWQNVSTSSSSLKSAVQLGEKDHASAAKTTPTCHVNPIFQSGNRLDKTSRWLFPTIMVIFSVTYWAVMFQ